MALRQLEGAQKTEILSRAASALGYYCQKCGETEAVCGEPKRFGVGACLGSFHRFRTFAMLRRVLHTNCLALHRSAELYSAVSQLYRRAALWQPMGTSGA